MHYFGISTYQFIPCSASDTHKHTHTCILKPFEDSKPTGLKVDIAGHCPSYLHSHSVWRPIFHRSPHSMTVKVSVGIRGLDRIKATW